MNIWLFFIIIILFLICIVLLAKIYIMKKSIKEIKSLLKEILDEDTNNLITISSSDKDVKNLASNLNIELKKIRKQKLQYQNGNQELKKTITNISHDIRTPLTAIKGYIDLIKDEKEKSKQDEYLKVVERKTNDLAIIPYMRRAI